MRDLGSNIARVGIAVVLLSIGTYKFTSEEANQMFADVSNSPFLSWLYKLGSKQFVSNIIGMVEILIGCLILLGYKYPKAALMGGLLGTCTFLVTLSFFVTSPFNNMYRWIDGWYFSMNPFVLKDLVFFGFCLQMTIDNW